MILIIYVSAAAEFLRQRKLNIQAWRNKNKHICLYTKSR